MGYPTPTCTPYPIKSAQVELRSERGLHSSTVQLKLSRCVTERLTPPTQRIIPQYNVELKQLSNISQGLTLVHDSAQPEPFFAIDRLT